MQDLNYTLHASKLQLSTHIGSQGGLEEEKNQDPAYLTLTHPWHSLRVPGHFKFNPLQTGSQPSFPCNLRAIYKEFVICKSSVNLWQL